MRLFSLDCDAQQIRARHCSARTIRELPDISGDAHHMQTEYRVGLRILKCALLDHELGAAFFA